MQEARALHEAPASSQEPLPPTRSQWPRHEPDELDAVRNVLESGRVNSLVHGEETRSFEEEFAAYTGVAHAIAVSNGTVSIELALRALEIGAGDEVIVPARSFFATVSAVVAVGARPVFADIDPETQNIDPGSVERMVSEATAGIICVHLAGQPCDMDRLCEIASRHRLALIEDCAQAHGASWRGRKVGSFGDAGSFSFCTDKIMSTGGEGGMLVMREEAVWRRAWAYKDHGKDPFLLRAPANAPAGEFRYCHNSFGSNFRMTEMQAAIGRRQLAKLDSWVASRRENARALLARARQHRAVRSMTVPDHAAHAFYKCYVMIDFSQLRAEISRADIVAELLAQGIACGSGSCPDMSREAAFKNLDIKRDGKLDAAHAVAGRTLMFQVDHTLGPDDTARYGEALVATLEKLEAQA